MENEYHRPRAFPNLGQELTFYGHCVQTQCPSFVQTTPNLQTQKTLQKPVDKWRKKCYNMQAVNEEHASEATEKKKSRKKLKKLLKNLLTNARECDIILGHFSPKGKRVVEELLKNPENFLKTFQKPLDKRKEMWYNNQVAQNAASAKETSVQIIDN